MPEPTDADRTPYPGLPPGAFDEAHLPPQAAKALGCTDGGIWSAAVNMYVNTVDPRTRQPYNEDQPLLEAAEGTVKLIASTCRSTAIEYSAGSDGRAAELVADATGHLTDALDHIEHCAGILDETVTGPDGEQTTGRQLQLIHSRDEELARQRSSEGDSRHTQTMPESAWRLLASVMLALLDVLLLWKPLLNLTWETSSGAVFRWAIGVGLAGLQVLCIEWAMRSYVNAERHSVDRRGAAGDYNRPLNGGRFRTDRPAPNRDELIDADTQLTHAYRWLVVAAACIGVIGGVRVAVLAKRAALPTYEAALFATIVGLILGAVVIQLARLYCRGNLLGDRLRCERQILAEIEGKIQHARGTVAKKRENAVVALAAAEVATEHAAGLRNRTAADYWSAVQLAWNWLGLPHALLDYTDFEREALPVPTDAAAGRAKHHEMLAEVNAWLADRPVVFLRQPAPAALAALAAITASEPTAPGSLLTPMKRPEPGQDVIVRGAQPVPVPAKPQLPHGWLLAGAAATMVAAVASAFLAPAPADADVVTVLSAPAPAARATW